MNPLTVGRPTEIRSPREFHQSWLVATFVLLFGFKPVIDLFWFMGPMVWHQKVNPAAASGLLFILLSVLMVTRYKVFQERWMPWFASAFLVVAIKVLFLPKDQAALVLRYLSSLSILAFLPLFLKQYRISEFQKITYWTSVGAIIVIALLQVFKVVPTVAVDTIQSIDIGRITGGYGHPLVLAEILSFAAVILLSSVSRMDIFRRPGVNLADAVGYGLLATIVFRATYRTGIILFGLLPLALLVPKRFPMKTRLSQCVLVYGLFFSGTLLTSTKLVSWSQLFGHSGGFVLNQRWMYDQPTPEEASEPAPSLAGAASTTLAQGKKVPMPPTPCK